MNQGGQHAATQHTVQLRVAARQHVSRWATGCACVPQTHKHHTSTQHAPVLVVGLPPGQALELPQQVVHLALKIKAKAPRLPLLKVHIFCCLVVGVV